MKITKSPHVALLFVLLLGLVWACDGPTDKPVEEITPFEPSTSLNGVTLSGTVPRDVAVGAADSTLAKFAWNEFIALNWQVDTSNSTTTRGTAQSGWTLSDGNPATTVWETYLHRTELVNVNSLATTDYTTGNPVYNNYSTSSKVSDPNSLLESGTWNLLDEDNEISSAFVFFVKDGDTTEVLYQAKANISEYEYLKSKYPTTADQKTAEKVITSDKSLLVTFAQENLFCAQDAANAPLGSKFDQTICLPCGDTNTGDEGAMEIKTAWRALHPEEDASKFITREVIYFLDSQEAGKVETTSGTMALIGMHVIHKTRNYPAFIFASWEHESVRNTADGKYIFVPDLPIGQDRTAEPFGVYDVLDRVPVNIPPQIELVNGYASTLVKENNSNSVLQYYNLIGVQATPIDYQADYQADSTAQGTAYTDESSFFLANYVIESDQRLTRFHGSFGDPFAESEKNVIWRDGVQLNMGGCQGCHGEANLNGNNYSFLLGSAETDPDIQQTFKEAYDTGHSNFFPKKKKTSMNMEEVKNLKASLEK